MTRRALTRLVLSVCGCTLALSAAAQPVLEELMVTANRRVESVQDVSASITALDEEAIRRAGIIDITGLEQVVPGLRIGRSGGEVRPAMRGARTNEVGVAGTGIAEQVVGIFQDGIYLPTTTAGLGAYADVQRIEVLRGPQGTLYGRNTFAGTINVITNQPDFNDFSAKLKATWGNYARQAYEGVFNIPLGERLATRLVVAADRHDGLIENLTVRGPSDDLRERNHFYARSTTTLALSDETELTLRLDHFKKDANSEAIWGYQQIAGYRIAETSAGSGMFQPNAMVEMGHIYQPDNVKNNDPGSYKVYRNAVSFDEQEANSATLVLDTAALGFASFKGTVNYSRLSGQQFYDNDYSDGGGDVVGGFGRQDDQKTLSLELQLASIDTGGRLSWVAGAYYFDQEADWEWLWRTDTNSDGINDRIVVPGWGNPEDDPHTAESLAFYGQATFSLSDALRLVAGLRHNEDEKSFTGNIADWDDSAVLWKAALEWDLQPDVMLYASAATGYRTGGANDARVVGRGAPAFYDNEDVISYELGVKSRLLDGRLTLNAALFSNEYSDVKAQLFAVSCNDPEVAALQSQTVFDCVNEEGPFSGTRANGMAYTDVTLGSTTFEYYENGGDISSTGLELEVQWLPTENLYLTGSFVWLDSEFDSGYAVGNEQLRPLLGLGNLEGRQDINDSDSRFSFAGWQPALNPEYTIGMTGAYQIPLANGSMLTPSLQFKYVDDYYAFDTNIPEVKQDAHLMADARLTWSLDSSGLEVEAFVLNLTDEEVMIRAVVHSQINSGLPINSVQVNWNNPRTWGVSVRYQL